MCLRFLPSTSSEVLTTSYEARADPHIGRIAELEAFEVFIYGFPNPGGPLRNAVPWQRLEDRHDRCRRRHLADRNLLGACDIREPSVREQLSGGVPDRVCRELGWHELQTGPDPG